MAWIARTKFEDGRGEIGKSRPDTDATHGAEMRHAMCPNRARLPAEGEKVSGGMGLGEAHRAHGSDAW